MKKLIKNILYILSISLLAFSLVSCGTLNTTIENKNNKTNEVETKTIKIGYDNTDREVINSESTKYLKYEIDSDYVGNYVEIIGIENFSSKDKILYKEYIIPIIIKNISDKTFNNINIDIKYFDSNDIIITTGKGSLEDTTLEPNEKARILINIDDKDMKHRISSFEISKLVFYEEAIEE